VKRKGKEGKRRGGEGRKGRKTKQECQWLMPIILATQEAKSRRTVV
jgi:hypothetical protein